MIPQGLFPIAELFPTQFTIGMREVDFKRKSWRTKNGDSATKYLSAHRIPVLIGPKNRRYIIDRHHLARALYDEGVRQAPISVVAKMNELSPKEFWAALESRNWTHPLDRMGQRRAYNDIPTSVCNLSDDPFRSLAGALKRTGAYLKDKAPFSEFRWADFLRARIKRQIIETDFQLALTWAMGLAKSSEAAELPGWRGPCPSVRSL